MTSLTTAFAFQDGEGQVILSFPNLQWELSTKVISVSYM